ncbi:hypothetical protein [Nocardia sp. NPDC057668]|uniref:hypothetical protein n=1 Tax=Nocardia sp. NPDC057668 TaxID=3346202 RepID=UPI00366ADF70
MEPREQEKVRTLSAAGCLGVEYAHIYTDESFSLQHLRGIAELHRGSIGSDAVKIVLVDDYSTDVPIEEFDMAEFLQQLDLNQARPDVVVLESELVKLCSKLVKLIGNRRLERGIIAYRRTRGKYPCSLLIATWYMLRLGVFGRPAISCVHGTADKLYTPRLLTILPDRFITPERQALDIIRATPYAWLIDRIDHIYFSHLPDVKSDWDEFDAEEYVERNYGRKILSEDREIIDFVINTLQEMNIKPGSMQSVADVGSGPNLYPALMVSPFIANDGRLELIDVAAPNLEYLRRILDSHDDEQQAKWRLFEEHIRSLGVPADLQKVKFLSSVRRGSIYELQPNRYDTVLSFFVSESITDDESEFEDSVASLMGSVKANGLFIVAHMLGSRGYFAGERTFFPAISLSMEQIQENYDKYGLCHYRRIGRDGPVLIRKGYEGMAVVVGRKNR